jgi:hypothetical protein
MKFNLLVAETTEQELFDHVVRHLATQQIKSANENGDCLYRSGGLSCAVGACFSEEYYDPEIDAGEEVKSARWLIKHHFPDAKQLAPLADNLQVCHDTSDNISTLKTYLKSLARLYNLDGTSIDTITSWEGTN